MMTTPVTPVTPEAFNPSRGAHVLVVTADVLSARMAGPAIRAWHIATALAAEHDVALVTTAPTCEVSSPSFTVRSVTGKHLRVLERWADVLVVQGFVLDNHPFLSSGSKVMVVDLYDPMHLEQLELHRERDEGTRNHAARHLTAVVNNQLRRGDYFMCASTRQRDFWLGQMSALGRLNPLTYDQDETLNSLISVVPFGLGDEEPCHTRSALKGVVPGIEEGDEVVLWAGGIYNWFDPLTLIRAMDGLRRRRPRVRLFFMGLKHPNPDVPEMRMASEARWLAHDLGLTDTHVFFNEGWVAYEDRQNYLLEADAGVSTHLSNLETSFSFRTRILDYIWSALPVVATEGDSFAELIERARLGLTVPPGDVAALEAALFKVLDDDEFAASCRLNLEGVRPEFAWSVVLRPLVEFCRVRRRAPDLADPEMSRALGGTRRRQPRLLTTATQHLKLAGSHLRTGGVRLVVSKVFARTTRIGSRGRLSGRASVPRRER
jgi:glycosyltransferase involved in cell wall biosynthesis